MPFDRENFEKGLVSVVMPSYNRAELTRRAVQSVLDQTYRGIQLVLVDDGSKDHTRQVFENFPGVEYRYQTNGGQANATNTGLSFARGEFIALLDSDDWWQLDFLEESVGALRRTNAGIAFSGSRQVITVPGFESTPQVTMETDKVLAPYCLQRDGDWYYLDPAKTRELLVQHCPTTTSGIVLRRECMLNQLDTKVRLATDVMFSLELAVKTNLASTFTLKPLWFKSLHDSNICDRLTADPKVNRRLFEAAVFDGHVMLEKVGAMLTADERALVRLRIAKSYFDLGYFESQQGFPAASLRAYAKSFRFAPSPKPLVAMAKAVARAGKRAGAK